MKTIKSIYYILSLLLISLLTNSQSVVNNDAKLVICENTSLVIKGNYINKAAGNILNSGNISITGNWTNNASSGSLLQGSYGEVQFNGSTTQEIGGTNQTHFYDLIIGSDVNINYSASVQHELVLSNYNIKVNDASLQMENGSLISGANSLAYIETEATGTLSMAVENTDQFFPVGTTNSYCPLILNNALADPDFYSVNVFPDVLDGGLSGTTIGEIDHCVNLTWNVEKTVPATTDLSITAQWNASDEGPLFDRTKSGIGHYISGSGWLAQEETPAGGSDPYTLTRVGITDLSPFAVGDIESPMASMLHLNVDVTVFLEGPYNGSDMNTSLNSEGIIPLDQPFDTPPWGYSGEESVSSIPNANVVDWVLVEYRDATDAVSALPPTMFARQAAFLLKDGTVVDLDGSSMLSFSHSFIHSLFVIVWHRNHLGVMSADPVTESGGVYTCNFTAGETMAHGGSAGHKELATGTNIWGMRSGDGDNSGEINMNDKTNIWILQAGKEGYLNGDFNLDGQVNNPDKNDRLIDNMGTSSQVPD